MAAQCETAAPVISSEGHTPETFHTPEQGKRKLSPNRPNNVRSELNISISPDGSIVLSPEAKKRKPIERIKLINQPMDMAIAEKSGGESEIPDSNQNNDSSEGYDTEDNRPLSQLTENDLVNTPARARNSLLRKTLKRRVGKSGNKSAQEDDSDLDSLKLPNNLTQALCSIQKSIQNLEQKQAETTASITKLEMHVKEAMNLAASKADVTELAGRISENVDKINSLCDGMTTLSVKVTETHKQQQDSDMNMAKNLSKIEQEKVHILRRITHLEEKMESAKNTEEKPTKSTEATGQNEKVKNIILEGLNEIDREDVYDTVVRTMSEIGMNIYDNDINKAYRIGSFKGHDVWPRPIRVELVSERIRNKIMEHRHLLLESQTHYRVRVSIDEPKETRKARAILRKTATQARVQGKRVVMQQNSIIIDGTSYTLQDAPKLDTPYKNALTGPTVKPKENVSYRGKIHELPAERETKHGLAFFTERSKKSCFYARPITYDNAIHKTSEHAYQWKRAKTSELHDLAEKIKEAETPARAKALGSDIPYNPAWEKIKGDVMEEIQWEKHNQHPDLADDLCNSDGLTLMEASPSDRYWGTGCLITDPRIETGMFPGRNELGRRLVNVRNRLLRQRLILHESMQMDIETALVESTGAITTDITVGAEVHTRPQLSQVQPAGCAPSTKAREASQTAPAHKTRAPPVSIEDTRIEVLERNLPIEKPKRRGQTLNIPSVDGIIEV